MTAKKIGHEAAIRNPHLQPFSILIGEWETVGKHRLLPEPLHGRTAFEWIEGGAFLKMSSEIDEPKVPSAISIIGSDDHEETFFMLYFDERGVSRKFETTLKNNVWTQWRTAPHFSQRFTATIVDNGDTIISVAELCEDDVTWMRDLEMTYKRVK